MKKFHMFFKSCSFFTNSISEIDLFYVEYHITLSLQVKFHIYACVKHPVNKSFTKKWIAIKLLDFLWNARVDSVLVTSLVVNLSRCSEYGPEPNESRITNLISQKCGIVEIAATKPLFTTASRSNRTFGKCPCLYKILFYILLKKSLSIFLWHASKNISGKVTFLAKV